MAHVPPCMAPMPPAKLSHRRQLSAGDTHVFCAETGAREAEKDDTFDTSKALLPRDAEGLRNLRDFLSAPAREQGRLKGRGGGGGAIEKALSEPLAHLSAGPFALPPSGPRAAPFQAPRQSAELLRGARLMQ